MEQNREPRNQHMYFDQLIFDKAGKGIRWSKAYNGQSINGVGKTEWVQAKKKERMKERNWTANLHHIQE